jgi:acyl-CoA reductase-like NAD-dependent aldehyde dehydrogenase
VDSAGRPEPAGVVAAITPFNYPLNLLCHKLGPGIAASTAQVRKPMYKTSLKSWEPVADKLAPLRAALKPCYEG